MKNYGNFIITEQLLTQYLYAHQHTIIPFTKGVGGTAPVTAFISSLYTIYIMLVSVC